MMVDVVPKCCKFVEAIVMEHQSLIHIFLLIEEEHAEALAEELLRLLF